MCVPKNDEDPSQGELGNIGAGGSSSFTNNNIGATKSAAETTAIAGCTCTTNVQYCVEDQMTYTGPGGTCTASTLGTPIDSVIYGFSPNLGGSCIGCNDDFVGLSSQFSWTATTGQTITFVKCSFDSTAQGSIPLTVTC